MRKLILTTAVAVLIGVSAMPAYAGDGQVVGTLMGAGLGGLIGNQFGHGPGREAATVGGVIFGGLIGNSIGSSMDRADYYYARPTYYYPQPVYYETNYVPNYVAPPAPPPESMAYYNNSAQTYCREYTQEIRVNGQMQESYGTACLQPDGSWRVVQ